MALYKRGDTWWIDIYVDGKRVRETTGTTNRSEAEKILARRLRGRQELTVNDLLDDLELEYQLTEKLDPKRVVYRIRRLRERLRSYTNHGYYIRASSAVGYGSSTGGCQRNDQSRVKRSTSCVHACEDDGEDSVELIFSTIT